MKDERKERAKYTHTREAQGTCVSRRVPYRSRRVFFDSRACM